MSSDSLDVPLLTSDRLDILRRDTAGLSWLRRCAIELQLAPDFPLADGCLRSPGWLRRFSIACVFFDCLSKDAIAAGRVVVQVLC